MRPARVSRDPAQRLLDEGGRAPAMLGIMAIMLFLTVLAAALGLGTISAARSLNVQLAGRLTVQLIEGDPTRRGAEAAILTKRLRALPLVSRVEQVDHATLLKLLQPWLGAAAADPSLPVPALIDVDISGDPDAGTAAVTQVARTVSANTRVDRHAAWMSPVSGFMTGVIWLAAAIVLLMALATGAVVVLAARAGLEMHRETIEVLHMLGSTDVQVARLFQRRIALDTLAGGSIGTAAAIVVAAAMGSRLGGLQSALLEGVNLSTGGWIALACLPLLFVGLAIFAARAAVLKRLGQTL